MLETFHCIQRPTIWENFTKISTKYGEQWDAEHCIHGAKERDNFMAVILKSWSRYFILGKGVAQMLTFFVPLKEGYFSNFRLKKSVK